MISHKTIERLIIYKFLLERLKNNGDKNIFSHKIAEMTGTTASQVRHDLMEAGCAGNQKNGYSVEDMINSIKNFLELSQTINMILVGVGNLGKALLRYYSNLTGLYSVTACFDTDRDKIGQFVFHSKCYHPDEMDSIVKDHNVNSAIITVPAQEAQAAADKIVNTGVKGIINFAPIRIKVPEEIYIEYIDFSVAVEKVNFFAKKINDVLR